MEEEKKEGEQKEEIWKEENGRMVHRGREGSECNETNKN